MSRRLRPPARRGQFFQVSLPQAPPAWISQPTTATSRKPRILPTSRRGVFFSAPRGQRMAHPGEVRQRKRLPTLRRGAFFVVPLPQRMPHPSIMRRQKRALLSLKRGQFFTVPYSVASQLAPWPPMTLRGARRPIAPIRRGVVFPVRFIGAAPVVTTRGVMFGVAGSGSTMSGVIGVGATMSGV